LPNLLAASRARAGGKNCVSVSTRDFDRCALTASQTFDRPLPAGNHVAHVLHGLAGIDRKAAKSAVKPRNKMQHGIWALNAAEFEKQSTFQRVYW
jgi:hypothetical protein